MLTKVDESYLLLPQKYTKYRSGVGKMMHVMQYSTLRMYNVDRDLTRHMAQPAPKYTNEILHCMKHCAKRPARGVVLTPTRLWDGSSDFRSIIRGNSNPDYARESTDCRSLPNSVVILAGT